jgi:metal-responsive CopG/Arc/MetJ family transcriptional regulator
MIKVLTPKNKKKPNRISVKIPKKLDSELSTHIEKNCLSKKARSKWISEAIEELSTSETYWLLVQEDWIERGNNVTIQVSFDKPHESLLTRMIVEVQKNLDEETDDLKSSIVRTAIIGKLMKEESL